MLDTEWMELPTCGLICMPFCTALGLKIVRVAGCVCDAAKAADGSCPELCAGKRPIVVSEAPHAGPSAACVLFDDEV